MNQQVELPLSKTGAQQWLDFHEKNPEVWKHFERFTFEAIRAGRPRFSHWAVMQRVRWETVIVTKGDDYKINNNLIAHYARFFIQCYPQHDGFFALRRLKK